MFVGKDLVAAAALHNLMKASHELLKGAYDLHVHCSPDSVPRAQSALTLAQEAAKAGMAGIGLKDHTCSTVGRCHVLNETFNGSPRFFSSIVLNPTVGGLNPQAVETALKSGCDIVYFPTFGARHQIDVQGRGQMPFPLADDFNGIDTLSGNHGAMIDQILTLIAHHDAILATGHLSPRESIELLRRAQAAGIQRTVVTHASEPVPGMTLEEQAECVGLGACIEHCFMACTQCCSPPVPLEKMAEQIRSIGPEHVVLSSDFGQIENGPPVEAFATHIDKLLSLGITQKEIITMIKTNPRRLTSKTL